MSYTHRVWLVLVLFLACGATGTGALLGAARAMAAQDMHVGHGSVKFPPQRTDLAPRAGLPRSTDLPRAAGR
jgi:hypothetical protein